MKKIQFILMASFVLGTCQLAVLSGAADELDVKESTIELSNNFVENSQVDNVQNSSETASEQVVEKASPSVKLSVAFIITINSQTITITMLKLLIRLFFCLSIFLFPILGAHGNF